MTTTGTAPAAQAAQHSLTIPGCKSEVARARAFITRVLGAAHPAAEVAVLLTSELVTNAVVHSRSRKGCATVTITLSHLGGWLRVEVTDAGSESGAPTVKMDVCAASGHGLFLVDALAHDWGYTAEPDRTTVWFSLAG